MLHTVENHDIKETLSLRESADLEDSIFLAVDKLQALCNLQSQLETSDAQPHIEAKTRTHYALVVEEQVNELRALLETHFG